ncbi:MAG TPA: RNA pseudouridine synthase [Bryobacteraceae bacterium]|nr:RNA pseudouridine synthase [Bryobacteraceae bacterium]
MLVRSGGSVRGTLVPVPAAEWGWLITPEELRSWVVEETPEIIAVNKPGLVVCHPSKHGPWSSLIGAAREHFGLERLHMPSRLDRETSGVVVLAKDHKTASRLQRAAERRRVRKTYYAILTGELTESRTVKEPLARDQTAAFFGRQAVAADGRPAETEFVPLAAASGFTFARVHPNTGRLHQIRVHAAWMGHAVAGDKLYGPDPGFMLEFIREGFTARMGAALPFRRHALHAAEIVFSTVRGDETFCAPLARDMADFCARIGLSVGNAVL